MLISHVREAEGNLAKAESNSKKDVTAIEDKARALAEAESTLEKALTMDKDELRSLKEMLKNSAIKQLEEGCSSVILNQALEEEEKLEN